MSQKRRALRNTVYGAINGERRFQIAMTQNDERPDFVDNFSLSDGLNVIQYNVDQARNSWYYDCTPYETTMHFIRKIAATAVNLGEIYGMPHRPADQFPEPVDRPEQDSVLQLQPSMSSGEHSILIGQGLECNEPFEIMFGNAQNFIGLNTNGRGMINGVEVEIDQSFAEQLFTTLEESLKLNLSTPDPDGSS